MELLLPDWHEGDVEANMYAKRAVDYYSKSKEYGCAQSILKSFQDLYDVTEETIVEYKSFGGGRAEGGLCGAVYAAKSLLDHESELATELESQFSKKMGTAKCREIRKANEFPCVECVRTAASLLQDIAERETKD